MCERETEAASGFCQETLGDTLTLLLSQQQKSVEEEEEDVVKDSIVCLRGRPEEAVCSSSQQRKTLKGPIWCFLWLQSGPVITNLHCMLCVSASRSSRDLRGVVLTVCSSGRSEEIITAAVSLF